MAAGIGASGAPCSVRAVCSDRRPSLPWTFPESIGPTIPRRGKGAADSGPRPPRKTLVGAAARSIRTLQQKGRPEGRPFPKCLPAGPDQFAALFGVLSVGVLSAVVGALTLTLMPCR